MLTSVGAESADHAIRLDRLTLGYGRKIVLHDVTGVIAGGALLALVGPNGAGKSTLLKAIAGLHSPRSGRILRSGRGDTQIAFLPQHGEIDRAFPMSTIEFIAMGLWREIGWWRSLTPARQQRIENAMAHVGLTGCEGQRVGTLSGGQLRRAMFARAALQDAPVVLLDEPFAGVDAETAEVLRRIIQDWHAQGRTIVVALHDLEQVRSDFPDVLLLAGQVVDRGKPEDVLTRENLSRAHALCAAPRLEPARDV